MGMGKKKKKKIFQKNFITINIVNVVAILTLNAKNNEENKSYQKNFLQEKKDLGLPIIPLLISMKMKNIIINLLLVLNFITITTMDIISEDIEVMVLRKSVLYVKTRT